MSEKLTLEDLKKHCIRTIEACEQIRKLPIVVITDDRRYQEHKMILELIEEHEQRQSGEWIPLKFRLLTEEEQNEYGNEYDEFIDCEMPDENEEVLLTLEDGTVSTDIYCQAEDCTHYFENYDFNHIKAWMHKPEGYKEEVMG